MDPSTATTIERARAAPPALAAVAVRYLGQALVAVAALAIVAAASQSSAAVDFWVYWAGGRAAAHGSYVDEAAVQEILRAHDLPRSERAPVPYGSPVLMATVFRPLGALAPPTAATVYFGGLALLLAWTAWRLSPSGVGVVLFGLVVSAPFLRALTLGNWSVATGCVLVLAYLDARAGRLERSGAWLSAAALWKVYPLVALVPFLVTRAWRVLFVAAALGIMAVALTVLVLGPPQFVEAVRFAIGVMRPDNPHAVNLSLPGVATHFSGDPLVGGHLAVVLPLCVAACLWAWRAAPVADLLALASVAMLLTGALTWDHYGTALFVFLPWLGDQRLSPTARRVGIYLFAVAMVPWFLLVAEDASTAAAYLRFPTLPGALAMTAFMAIVVHRKTRVQAEVRP
jgi:hypothetical protein